MTKVQLPLRPIGELQIEAENHEIWSVNNLRFNWFTTQLESLASGMDYLSDLKQWRARCDVEDTIVRGLSLRLVPQVT